MALQIRANFGQRFFIDHNLPWFYLGRRNHYYTLTVIIFVIIFKLMLLKTATLLVDCKTDCMLKKNLLYLANAPNFMNYKTI